MFDEEIMAKKRGIKKKINQEENLTNPNPRNTTSDLDAKDYISHLPGDILYRIISLLPFQSAVRTASLSSVWKDTWKRVWLAMVEDASSLEDAAIAIKKFIEEPFEQIHDPPSNNWGFQFNFGEGRVLTVAIAPSNNTLLLDFSSAREQESPPWPFHWLLILERHVSLLYTTRPSPRQMILNSLHLKSVSSLSCKGAVSSILSSLPFLRSLTIENCNGLHSLLINAFRLQKLAVLDCPQLTFLCWNSYLKSFRYRGKFVLLKCKISLSNNSSDAMLDFRQGLTDDCYNISSHDLNDFITSISSLSYLTLCRWFCESFILPLGTDREHVDSFSFVKELWWIERSVERKNVDVLLSFLKQCDSLERLYVTIDPKSYNMKRAKSVSGSLPGFREILPNLKLLILDGFRNERQEIAFAMWLIPFCTERPEILARSSDGTCSRYLVEVPQLEMNGESSYRFEVSKNKACPDHIHMKYG